MKYRIELKRSAAKALKKFPRVDQKRISNAIDNLAENLPNPNLTKMKGNNPFHKIRVGDYRIIQNQSWKFNLYFEIPLYPPLQRGTLHSAIK